MTKISLNDGHLYYTKYGTGNKILLAFHGFGQDKSKFDGWIDIMGDEYTIYAFDLFYHGSSTRDYRKLDKAEWVNFLNLFLEKEDIGQFSVIGFSLGGRFAIATAIEFSNKTKALILIAPDGIFLTIWFKLVTTPGIRWVYKYLVNHPDKLDNLLQFNVKVGLVDQYIADFAKKEMGDSAGSKRIYTSWNQFKSLGYTRKELVHNLGAVDYEKHIILGNKDRVIHPNNILPIIHQIGRFKIDILPLKHHQLMGKTAVELIVKNFRN